MNNAIRLFVLLLASYALLSLRSLGQQNEPSWPQQFQVLQGEPTSFGFAVTQPGPIVVSVSTQGQPVTATLTGPLPQPVQQSGSGRFVLTYNATAADVQKSALWVVELAATGSTPAPTMRLPIGVAATRASAPVMLTPAAVASGSITVQHPATNPQTVQVQLQQSANAIQLQRQQINPQLVANALAGTKAAYVQQLASQQASQKRLLLSTINASIAQAPRPGALVPTALAVKSTTSTASTGSGTAGSGNIQTVVTPTISSLSVSHGQPGDPVMISGSGFGASIGEVHFIVNAGMDLAATAIDYWSDTQILTSVPDASGISTYAGGAYVKSSAGQKSTLASFEFDPTLDFATLAPLLTDTDANVSSPIDNFISTLDQAIAHGGSTDPFGHKANDVFYQTLLLKNGCVVDSVNVPNIWVYGDGAASAIESRVGTNSPYLKVHWWINAFSEVEYKATITIKGPKGLSCL